MRVKTPNNTKIHSYLKPNTIYEAVEKGNGYFEYNNHTRLDENGTPSVGFASLKRCGHLRGQDWIIVSDFENRQFLRDFVSLNQIKTTLVSRSLGYSRNWLTQAMNRTDRGDLTDEELQAIMKQLHVDWTQETFVHVKATKTHSAYRTRPCVYEHAKHKELLQRAFWDGRIVNGR